MIDRWSRAVKQENMVRFGVVSWHKTPQIPNPATKSHLARDSINEARDTGLRPHGRIADGHQDGVCHRCYYNSMYKQFFSHVDMDPANVHVLKGNAPDLEPECIACEEKIKFI